MMLHSAFVERSTYECLRESGLGNTGTFIGHCYWMNIGTTRGHFYRDPLPHPSLSSSKSLVAWLHVLLSHVSYSLNSLKGGYIGNYIRDCLGVIKGDTRSLDHSSCVYLSHQDLFAATTAIEPRTQAGKNDDLWS